MRILLVTGNYLPGRKGGIENYTHCLATTLLHNHFEVEVAALNLNKQASYIYQGIKVNYLEKHIDSFEDLLRSRNFNICHFHEYSEYGGIEVPWFRKAREYCKKIFFTFHLPYLTCYKNDFRYKGDEDCSNFSDPKRCANCIIADKFNYRKWGKSEGLLRLLQSSLKIVGKKQKLTDKIRYNHQQLSELLSLCDQVFIIASWFEKLLKENGYHNEKIKLLPNPIKPNPLERKNASSVKEFCKIAFAGRIQRQKGLHLLCKAMQEISTRGIELDVYGNRLDEKYFENCIANFSFNYKGIVPRLELLTLLTGYDFLVLPSVFTEMYPMVIQEAFGVGLPVIASAAKGNVDVINDGINGFLFEYDNAKDLAATIDRAYQLKKNGWLPQFEERKNTEKGFQEILSYYEL